MSQASWAPGPARYGIRIQHNVAVPMSDGTVLRVDVHYPADPATGQRAGGPFPVLLTMTPYGKKAPPPAGQLGAGATPYLIRRGYIEVIADVRGTGASGGVFEMFGDRQLADGVELVRWAAALPGSSGRVGMFGVSYLAINQLFTASGVGPGSPLKAIFPMMAANDFFRDAATMGGIGHMTAVRRYASSFAVLGLLNAVLEAAASGGHPRPRSGGLAGIVRHRLDQRRYFRPLIADAVRGGEITVYGGYWASKRPASVLPQIAENGVAVLLIGGWHDIFQRGAPLNYAGLQNAWSGRPADAPMLPGQPVTGRFQLIMGPWYHITRFHGINVLDLQLRWFDHWLKDVGTGVAGTQTPLTLLPVNGGRIDTDCYPLPATTPTRLYLAPGGLLARQPGAPTTAWLSYARRGPVPGRTREQWSLGMPSYLLSLAGRPIRYEGDRREMDRGNALGYTTEPFGEPALLAGPIALTIWATASTTETIWIAHLDLLAPDGRSRPLSEGALLGSHRALDPDKTWYTGDGDVLRPYHPGTAQAVTPVVPGEVTRYDVEIFPTAVRIAAGDRLRITLTTADFPQLIPSRPVRRALHGGLYLIHQGGPTASRLIVPLAIPAGPGWPS